MFLELRERLTAFDEWKAHEEAYPELKSGKYISEVVASIGAAGFIDPFHGLIAPGGYLLASENYREEFSAHGCSAKYRAVLLEMLDYVLVHGWCSTVFLAEDGTPFAEVMTRHFPYSVKAAYLPDPSRREILPHLHHEDPMALSLPNGSFDMYISLDSIVHSPSTIGVLREARRILRRGGAMIATMPFRYGEPESEIRAEIRDQKLVHYAEPLYFGDPLDPSGTRLVYSVPGWDILGQARAAGFRSAEIIARSSRNYAVLGGEVAAVFVLKAVA